MIASLMSSSAAMDESTLTTSKSTGTQQKLANHEQERNLVSAPIDKARKEKKKCIFRFLRGRTGTTDTRGGPTLGQSHLQVSEWRYVCLRTVLVVALKKDCAQSDFSPHATGRKTTRKTKQVKNEQAERHELVRKWQTAILTMDCSGGWMDGFSTEERKQGC